MYILNIFEDNITYPKLMRTYSKLLRANGMLAPKFVVATRNFGVGALKQK